MSKQAKSAKKSPKHEGVQIGKVIRGLMKIRKSGRRYIPAANLRSLVVKLAA